MVVVQPRSGGQTAWARLGSQDVHSLSFVDEDLDHQLGTPPTYPMTALAASAGGSVLFAGSPDGLFRSDDAGRSWDATSFRGSPFALAVSTDGSTVAVVDRTTELFRSPDRGSTWPGP